MTMTMTLIEKLEAAKNRDPHQSNATIARNAGVADAITIARQHQMENGFVPAVYLKAATLSDDAMLAISAGAHPEDFGMKRVTPVSSEQTKASLTFEQWAKITGYDIEKVEEADRGDGRLYQFPDTQAAWDAWQAAQPKATAGNTDRRFVMELITAVHGMIGYCDSLKPGNPGNGCVERTAEGVLHPEAGSGDCRGPGRTGNRTSRYIDGRGRAGGEGHSVCGV
jgi:hypothetical protein